MTRDEYYGCAKDLLVAVEALRNIQQRMGDFAVAEQHATWDCLERIWEQLWEGFDSTHPEDVNPFSGPSWERPPWDKS